MSAPDATVLLLTGMEVAQEPFAAAKTPGVSTLQIHCVQSLAGARIRLHQGRFDILCSRLDLADSRGLETLEHLRKAAPVTPLIALLSNGESGWKTEALARGATECLTETDSPSVRLAALVRSLLERRRTEERLREHEAFLWLVSENVTDLVAVIDRNGRRLYNSPSYRPLVQNVDELCGTESFREVHPADRERIKQVFRETVESGVGRRAEYRFITRSGEVRHVESQGSVILDAEGRTSKVVVISRDVTERNQAEEALRESEQRYKRLLDSTTDYIFSVSLEDERAIRTTHGPGCVALTGYTPEEFVSERHLWHRMIHPDDQTNVESQVNQILRGEIPSTLEHRIVRKNGVVRWIRKTVVPHRDKQGKVAGYDGVVSDITERKEAERAVAESQERLALVIEGSSDGIWDWNVTTNEVHFSVRWMSMLGYSEGEIEYNFSAWERLLHPEDRERALATVAAYFEGTLPTYELEHRLRHKDGSYRWILARGVALRDAAGRPLRMAGSHVDVTERKRDEARLKLANVELARSEVALRKALVELSHSHEQLKAMQLQLIQSAKLEVVGTLAAGVAHEVRNPLQTLLMGLAYLEKSLPPDAETQRSVTADMRDALRRADSIVRELLELSAPAQLVIQPEDLNDLVSRSLRLVNHELSRHRVSADLELNPELPTVPLDTAKIQQVLLNLFVNAIHAMPQGGRLAVRTRLETWRAETHATGTIPKDFIEGEPLVVTEVEDTGTGIPEEILSRVFDPFFTTKPMGLGTGLGLSIARRIIELHGGGISILNRKEGGVRVTLLFKHNHTTNP